MSLGNLESFRHMAMFYRIDPVGESETAVFSATKEIDCGLLLVLGHETPGFTMLCPGAEAIGPWFHQVL